MSTWGGGYVTDVEYTMGYYVEQSPHHLAMAALLNGVPVDLPWRNPRLHYLELGCGRGLNALIHAAANPGWRVTAIDFNPAAVAEARRMAAAAGLDNVTFLEADLSTFAESPEAAALPEVDTVSLHGVWSWVGDPVRAGIVRLLRARLRAGGMVHVSYMAMPGMQGALGMQRLLYEAGVRLAHRSDKQVLAAREVVQELAQAGARQLTSDPLTTDFIKAMATAPVPYLAHEYMNVHWRPSFHADVAREMAAARLEFGGSVRLFENFPDLMLTAEQRAVYERFEDPLVRDLVVDTCARRTFRHDLYVRGRGRMSPAERDAMLRELRLLVLVEPKEFAMEVQVSAGKASLNREFYEPVVAALAERPRTLGEVLDIGRSAGRGPSPSELLGMLVGTHRATLVAHPEAQVDARIKRCHALLAQREVQPGRLNDPTTMISPRLGAGVPSRVVELFLVDRIGAANGRIDPEAFVRSLAPDLPAAEQAKFVALLQQVVHDRLAVWRNLGLV